MPELFDKSDLEQIRARGIAVERALSQLETLRKGVPPIHLDRPCTAGDGITVLPQGEIERLAATYGEAARWGRATKFVPASGAATRMFQPLLAVKDSLGPDFDVEGQAETVPDFEEVSRFFREIRRFAFYEDLAAALNRNGKKLDALVAEKEYGEVLRYLLTDAGLDYADLPKGLIKFHRYRDHSRTAFEEHLAETAAYVQDDHGAARIHFTVAPEYREAIGRHLDEVQTRWKKSRVKFEISLSVQKPSTDTLAVDLDHRPFRDEAGRLIFRPGGHGALLENLGELSGDIVFIKNIDNVVPDRLKGETCAYKKALGGLLVELQQQAFGYLRELARPNPNDQVIERALDFASRWFAASPGQRRAQSSTEQTLRLLVARLNRPLRICGMVRTPGAPGGGPFWAGANRESLSPQIVESSEVDLQETGQRAIWESSTHFNPVDIVCGLKDFQGKPFNLKDFSDPAACFIAIKSMDGRDLKALELPGLWNGGMAHWNTVFVEVPVTTFNPVKTVLDLLDESHQAG